MLFVFVMLALPRLNGYKYTAPYSQPLTSKHDIKEQVDDSTVSKVYGGDTARNNYCLRAPWIKNENY